MFVFYEIHVRGVKHIGDRICAGNIRVIIPKDNLRVLEKRPKTVGMAVPGRPQTTEQSMTRRTVDALKKGVVYGDLTMGGKGSLDIHCSKRRRAVIPRRGCDAMSRAGVTRNCLPTQAAAKLDVNL